MGTAWKVTANNSDSSIQVNLTDEMLAQLKQNQVTILKGPDSHENGKFLELLDLEGNKVTLWEPMIWDEKNKKS